MSIEALEMIVVIVGALIIIGAVIEVARMVARHKETRRHRFLEETRADRWRRQQVGEAE